MADFGLTDQGFVAPRSTDLLDPIRETYEDLTGLSIDWADDTFLGIMTQVIAEVAGRQSEALQAIADSRDPNNATGYQLDTIAQIVGIERIDGEFSAVDLTLTGDDGTTIPEDSEVEHPNGTLWYTQDAATIANGTALVQARPDEVGSIEAPSTGSWLITTPVDGWDGVTSGDDATPGRARETDAELRFRRAQSLQITGAASLGALRANILEVEGVQAAVVVDNDQDSIQTIAGLDLNPKSFAVVVYPALTTEQNQDLATEIYSRAPAGIESMGDEEATITGGDGFEKTVRWFIADEILVDVEVEYTGSSGLGEDIEEAIEAYFDGLAVGQDVRRLPILGAIANIDGVDTATVELNGGTEDIGIDITEIADLDTLTVSEA